MTLPRRHRRRTRPEDRARAPLARSTRILPIASLIAFTLLFAGGGATASAVPPAVTITDIGTLGGTISIPTALNAAGQVIGRSSINEAGHTRPFLWTKAGGMVDVATLGVPFFPAAISDNGHLVGARLVGAQAHAVSWAPAGGVVDLGTLGGNFAASRAVNAAGQVVGSATLANRQEHAFFATEAGGMVDLGTLGGTSSNATALNASGRVVGSATTAGGEQHAFSWTQGGGMVDLGTLGGNYSTPVDVNAHGQVVGESALANGVVHAFSWTPGGGMVDLGPAGDTMSHVVGVNDAGEVAGSFAMNGQSQAFLWTHAGGMVALGTLGGTMSLATDVNSTGQVVGSSRTFLGEHHAFSWTKADGMVDLGGSSSGAAAVNASGQIVGTSAAPNGQPRATLWELSQVADMTAPNPPTPTADRAPEYAGGLGWHRDSVTVSFAANGDPDGPEGPGSGVDAASVPAPVTFTTTGWHTATGTVKDLAGNESSPATLDVRIDATDPVLSFMLRKADGAAYTPGTWTNQPVTVTAGCTDEGSGIASVTPAVTLSSDGANQFVRATCVDRVGHAVTRMFTGIKIDRTPPEIEASFDPAGAGLQIRGRDAGSGVPASALAPDPPAPAPGRAFKSRQTYMVADAAGNRVVAVLDVKANGSALEASFVSLRYGDGPTVATPGGDLTFSWQLVRDGSLSRLVQRVRTPGSTATALYSVGDGTTLVTTPGGGRETHAGLVLLRAVTSGGAVELAPLP